MYGRGRIELALIGAIPERSMASRAKHGSNIAAARGGAADGRERARGRVAELRAEARRLLERLDASSDREQKRDVAERALALGQRAEMIAAMIEDPASIGTNIRRWSSMLAGGISETSHRAVLDECLAEARLLVADLRR